MNLQEEENEREEEIRKIIDHKNDQSKSRFQFSKPKDLWAIFLFLFHFLISFIYAFIAEFFLHCEECDQTTDHDHYLSFSILFIIFLSITISIISGISLSLINLFILWKSPRNFISYSFFLLFFIILISTIEYLFLAIILSDWFIFSFWISLLIIIIFSSLIVFLMIRKTKKLTNEYLVITIEILAKFKRLIVIPIIAIIFYTLIVIYLMIVFLISTEYLKIEYGKIIFIIGIFYIGFSLFWSSVFITSLVRVFLSSFLSRFYFFHLNYLNNNENNFNNNNNNNNNENNNKKKKGIKINKEKKKEMIKGSIKGTCIGVGSICFGSLITSLISPFRSLFSTLLFIISIDHPLIHFFTDHFSICLSPIHSLLIYLDAFFKFFNKYSFTYIGIYGFSFIKSGKETSDLLILQSLEKVIDQMKMTISLSISIGAISLAVPFVLNFILYLISYLTEMTIYNSIYGEISFLGILIGFGCGKITTEMIGYSVPSLLVCVSDEPSPLPLSLPSLYSILEKNYPSLPLFRFLPPSSLSSSSSSSSSLSSSSSSYSSSSSSYSSSSFSI